MSRDQNIIAACRKHSGGSMFLIGLCSVQRNKLIGETKKYYWDSENRMIKYEHLASDISPVDSTALYKYDIYGRRIQKDVNGAIINFMWEGDNVSLELDSANQPIRKYFTEMGMDDYFAHLNYAEVTNWSQVFSDWYPQGWYGYIKDQVGTIYKVWDHNTRTIADNRTYDSFGNLVNQSGTTKTQLGFQGKYYDQESGLNYFYHRYYNPTLGRFISEDRNKDYLNLSLFVNSNPVNAIDPFGLEINCTRNSEWKRAMTFSNTSNQGTLVKEYTQEDWELAPNGEVSAIPLPSLTSSDDVTDILYNCSYFLKAMKKIKIFKKNELYEAEFSCTDTDTCKSWTEKRRQYFENEYPSVKDMKFIMDKYSSPYRIYSIGPCAPHKYKEY